MSTVFDKANGCRGIYLLRKDSKLPIGSASGKEPCCQCRSYKRCGFNPWVGKIPWRMAWQPIPVFLPEELSWTEEPGGLQSIGSQTVGHDWRDSAHMLAPYHW